MRRKRAARERGEEYTPPSRTKAPTLLPANFLAWTIFDAARTQIISAGMGGAIALSHAAWDFYFRVYEVPRWQWRETFEKLRLCEDIYITHLNGHTTSENDDAGKDPADQTQSRG